MYVIFDMRKHTFHMYFFLIHTPDELDQVCSANEALEGSSSPLTETYFIQSGVGSQGKDENMQWCGCPGAEISTTAT